MAKNGGIDVGDRHSAEWLIAADLLCVTADNSSAAIGRLSASPIKETIS
jgi:hypothetical protein